MAQLKYDIVQDKDLAMYITNLLKAGGVDVSFNESLPYYDSILGDIDSMHKYEILVNGHDFDKADSLLTQALLQDDNWAAHPMHAYTHEALLHMVEQPEKQSRLQLLTARILCTQRGLNSETNGLIPGFAATGDPAPAGAERSLSTLSKILLVLVCITGLGFVIIGVGGVVVGMLLYSFKLNNARGQLYYCFDASTRSFGLALTTISTIVILLAILWLNAGVFNFNF